jgi:16S rRNA (cytidine1402-2'-O)-methyltransferase
MGILYVVATPIGNLEDISIRAIKILMEVPVVVCEDTRHTGQLLKVIRDRYVQLLPNPLGSNPKLISVRDWNEAQMVELVVREAMVNDVALVCDAGTPLLSDPGFKVVRKAREVGIKVVPIPGAFAGAAALSAAGLPTNKFLFWGFLPKKWELEAGLSHVIYESPVRASQTCARIAEKYPQAQIVVAMELTKIHETIQPYTPGMGFKGEVTIVVYIKPLVQTYGGEQVAASHGDGDGDAQDGENGGGDVG